MTTTNSFSRQPTKLDYLSPTQFRFQILKLPKVEFFVTKINLPGISIDVQNQTTPFKDLPLPGEKVIYQPFQIEFIVDENLENFRELHGWIYGLGFPSGYTDFQNLLAAGSDRFPKSALISSAAQEAGKTGIAAAEGAIYSDATLSILTSKNNSNIEVRFSDVFPSELSGISFDQQSTDVNYVTATATFQYKIYEFATTQSSRTTVTQS